MRTRATLYAVLALLVIWQLGSFWVTGVTGSDALPGPVEVIQALFAEIGGELPQHILLSGYRVLFGIGIAVAAALPLGLAMGQVPRLNRVVSPLIYLTYPIPKIVFLPVIFLFLGIYERPKIFLIALILFFQVLVVVRDAANAVRPELILSVRSLGARRRHLLRYVYLPATLPAILTSVRVSIGTAIAVLFLAEQFGTGGLGYYILNRWGLGDYEQMYAGVLATSILGFAFYSILEWVERRVAPWTYLPSGVGGRPA